MWLGRAVVARYCCHQLQHPIHSIKGCLDCIFDRIAASATTMTTSDAEDLRAIWQSVLHMQQITEDVRRCGGGLVRCWLCTLWLTTIPRPRPRTGTGPHEAACWKAGGAALGRVHS